ncbi:MAG: hypothetical protein ACI9KE_003848 [Polyangiales bacterium]|jgi:hypothetical protein
MKSIVLVCVATLFASCLPATQTIVELTVSEGLANQEGELEVVITDEDGRVVHSKSYVVADESWDWPAEIPISPRGGDATRRFTFSATLTLNDGDIVVRAVLGFAEATEFRVHLSFDESCRDRDCGPEFTCDRDECVSIFRERDECELPAGVACDIGSGCGCPDAYVCLSVALEHGSEASRATCAARAPASICTRASDCDEDELCARDGGCQPASTTLCEHEGPVGVVGLGGRCEGTDYCRADLFCMSVPSLDDDLGFNFMSTGYCAPRCNPCQSDESCPSPHACVALAAGGGVCSRSGIALEGETCDRSRFCGRGLSCFSDRCVRLCRGHFAGTDGPTCAIRSADCDDGELCTGRRSDSRVGFCEPGAAEFPSPAGGICTIDSKCPCPLECLPTGRGDSRFCALKALSTCDDCLDDTECSVRTLQDGREHVACVVPASLRDFDECYNAGQCQSGYCSPDDGLCRRAR